MQRPKTKSKKLVVFFILLTLCCAGLFFLWNSSLFGKQLPRFSGERFNTFTPLPTQPGLESSAQPVGSTPAIPARKTPEVVATSIRPVCGQSEPMLLLGLGIDEVEQADVIRLVRVDFRARRILILSIPRDLLVPIPGLEEYGVTENKINAAYGYGEYYLGSGQGVVQISNTIFQNYGVEFDRYAVFHFSNFEQMVDAVGGVDINLDESIGAYAVIGPRHLDGAKALEFVRMRDADNDIYRARRQSEILKSLYAKILLPENIIKIPGLGIRFLQDKTLLTDVAVKDVFTFACFARELSGSSLVFRELPAELYYATTSKKGASILVPAPGVAEYIQDLILLGNY